MPHWTKTDTGYRLEGGPIDAELTRVGKTWSLSAANRTVALGKRASFNHAEAILRTLTNS